MSRFDLCIPYSEKDEVKKTHKIRFDPEKKIWFIICDELHDDLKKYEKVYVDISYEDKDIYKKKCKSLGFDFKLKSWYISMEEFMKNSGLKENEKLI
jgi:hypothetical protein